MDQQNSSTVDTPRGEAGKAGGSPLLAVLRRRDFRLMWTGESISLLGDQFYLIAMPWLVLQLTGDALAMGTVLAVAGVPRALFMLLGGALTDRFSPRLLMLWSNLMRLVMVSLLAGLVMTGSIQVWMLYVFALLFGVADAFFYPAQTSIVPQLVEREQLQAGNSLLQGTAQLSLFVGPVVAGLMIALLGGSAAQAAGSAQVVPEAGGIGLAFAIDAASFLVSAITLMLIRLRRPEGAEEGAEGKEGILSSIANGLRYVRRDRTLRSWFVIIALMNFLVIGPISVGIPVLADSRLPEGAAAYGIILSAYGAGTLLGMLLAGVLPRPAPQRMGLVFLILSVAMGAELAVFGLSSMTVVSAALALLTGAGDGWINIMFMTWLQLRTPPTMLGRVMSLLMFAAVGLAPISTSLSGALIDLNVTAVFVGTGGLIALVNLLAALSPSVREMGKLEEAAIESLSPTS
jgi:MFS family permease